MAFLQSLQSRVDETNLAAEAGEICPVVQLERELVQLRNEIRALYKASMPAALIHQIVRGAHEQAAIADLMLEDCQLRSKNRTLNQKHIANANRWIAGVRRFMENRKTAYGVSVRRKFYLIKPQRAAQ